MNRWQNTNFKRLEANSKLLYFYIFDNRDKEGYFTIDRDAIKQALNPLTEAEIKTAFKGLSSLYMCTPDKKKLSLIALNNVGKLPFDEQELKERRKRFVKPTVDEVSLIIKDKILAQKFYNHYEGNGWVIGRVKMIDWKFTANNWVINDEDKKEILTNSKPKSKAEAAISSHNNFMEKMYGNGTK